MTNENPILILEHIKELNTMDPEIINEEDVKALDRAIQALKTEPFLISEVYNARATIKELLNRIYGMQAREKRCINCQYYVNHYGYGQCFGQKNAPRVKAEQSCEGFKRKEVTKND